jgi:aarF domain-containing kinase
VLVQCLFIYLIVTNYDKSYMSCFCQQEVERSFSFWGTSEGDAVHPAECMHQLLEQVRRHKVNIDGNVCTVMVTTLVLEGWQRKLDPDYNVMKTLQTLLFKEDWAKSLQYTIEGLMAP